MSGRLVLLSSAAIVSIYAVGFAKTYDAAGQITATELASAAATISRSVAATPSSPSVVSALVGIEARDQTAVPATVLPTATIAAPAASATPLPRVVVAASPASMALPQGQYRDGTYSGMGQNRHGDLEVTVVIASGRIASANITMCGMQYPCSRIARLPGQAVSRQSANVDLVSGATMSAQAYRQAMNQALTQATA
jgi:uncharacterized protein with FMN-binding domain